MSIDFAIEPRLYNTGTCCAIAELGEFQWPKLTPEKVKKAADLCRDIMNQEKGRQTALDEGSDEDEVDDMFPPYTVVFATLIDRQITQGYEDVLIAAGFEKKWQRRSLSTNNMVHYYEVVNNGEGF